MFFDTLSSIRKKIILKDDIYYFDWTASGLAYEPIEDEIKRVLATYANVHSASASNAKKTSDYYKNARDGIKKLLGLDENFYLLPCGFGSTAAIKRFQEIMGVYIPPVTRRFLNLNKSVFGESLPYVIISPYEHHSNEISWRNGLCEVERTPLDGEGGVDWSAFKASLEAHKNRKIIVSFSAASNVTGVRTDIARLSTLARKYNAVVAIDASCTAPYENIDCTLFDALFISSHKFLGGVGGCGLLAIRKSLCMEDEPTFAGGGTVDYVSRTGLHYYEDFERMEDAGTPGVIQLIRAYLALQLRAEAGLENIEKIEKKYLEYFDRRLREIPHLTCYCPPSQSRLPIFAFNIDEISPYDAARLLSHEFGVQSRAGCSCAGPYGHDLMGYPDGAQPKPAWVRVSLHYTQTYDDLDYLLSAIRSVAKRSGSFIGNLDDENMCM